MFGGNTGAVPVSYIVSYFGENITNGTVDITVTSAIIDFPAVDSDVNVYVTAMNVFGTGNNNTVVMDNISELHDSIDHTRICSCVV